MSQAVEKDSIEKDRAAHTKKDLENKYNPIWHPHFGSYVTHETKHVLHSYLGQVTKTRDNANMDEYMQQDTIACATQTHRPI